MSDQTGGIKWSTTYHGQLSYLHAKGFGPTDSEELCSQSIIILKLYENVKVP